MVLFPGGTGVAANVDHGKPHRKPQLLQGKQGHAISNNGAEIKIASNAIFSYGNSDIRASSII